MTWHAIRKCMEPGKMQHPVDGRAWKNFDTKYPDFTKEPRNIRLGLAADGFNPFGNLIRFYSMWPVILTTYNLPPWLCMKESSFMLTLLIPSTKYPGKDIDVYLRPLIDDLKDLRALKSVKTLDVATCQKFNMRAMVLWTNNDFLARSKTTYVNQRRFSKKPHKYRRSLDFNGETEDEDPPRKFDRVQIMAQLARMPMRVKGKHPRWHIRPRWMYPFKRYIKKLKNYVRNKAKPKGSIAKGYVAEEALTFSSHYFWDFTTKFNRPDANVDCPLPTCQFQVFRSVCKSIGLRSIIRFDHQELKKVIWNVLHNSPEIDTYWAKFKSEFPNQDMKEESPGWFGSQIQRHIDKDPGVSVSSELFAFACGPTQTPISVNSCVVNGVRFFVHSRDERRTTQKSDICSSGEKDGEMYYGQLEEILEFLYMSFKVVLFRVKWFDTSNEGRKVKRFVIRNNVTQIWTNDGQSMDVDAPPDIIDVDEDDDIIDKEDTLPHDLADSDDEDLVNVDDDDDVALVYSNVSRCSKGSRSDGGGDDRKSTRKPNLGGRKSCRLNTRKETQNLWLRRITDLHGSQPIRSEWSDRGTLMPLGNHTTHWANLLGEIVREFLMHYRCWHNILAGKKAGVLGKIESQFDLAPHTQSDLENWIKINTGIQQHLAKIYTDNKSALKAEYWLLTPKTGLTTWNTSDPDVRRTPPKQIGMRRLSFGLIPRTLPAGHISSVGRVLARQGMDVLIPPEPRCTHTANVDELKKTNKQLKKQMDMIMKVFRSDDKMSQLLTQIQSQAEVGSGNGSARAGDDEPGDDEDADEDEEDEDS
nr:hypothetical protein [Tanacetum cinerariifolium]